jgi:hypothetical protein
MALLSSLGCKQEEPQVQAADYPGEMAKGYCNAVFSCQCEDYPYANPNECFGDLLESYDTVNDEAFLAGLLYDGTCPAQELDAIQQLACRGALPALPAGVCAPPCNVWHGQQQAGFPCQVLASSAELGLAWSNCGQGLTCTGSVCVNPCQSAGPLPAIGQPCPAMVCAAGAVCDPTLVCVAAPVLPGAGQPCLDGVCNASSVCVAAANTCAALPVSGQPCIQGQCELNAMCNADSLCIPRTPLACFLLGGGIPGDGDGDGDPTGDGDGDGDGDPTGDGDGDLTGDGDGDGDCSTTFLPEVVPVAWQGSTVDGTLTDAGSCGGASGPEVKLTYIAPQSGLYLMSTEGSNFDTILYVRDGSCTGGELACDDDTAAPASVLEVSLSAGQEVTIFVDSFDAAGGTYTLAVTLLSP